ncbi:MAG: PhnD/SsuA/transferrin family substrate-binding protein [Planctomycetes bacterium]|nr:PhnD/SsuA/transferrin family substrate-binding protein [Planctomycetota bacterium]
MRSLFLALLACGLLASEQAPLVFALKPDKNPEAMAAERQELARALSQALARPVQVIVPLSAAVIATGFSNGTIDAAHLSATDLARELDKDAEPVAQARLAVLVKGRTWYESVWLCRADRPYRSIADLAGKPVAFASKTSTSGCIIPLFDLQQRGLLAPGSGPQAFFGEVFYGTGYVSAVERVLDGSAEAAAVSDYVYEGDKHLTAQQKAQLRVLQRQGPVPSHVIALRRTWSPPEAEAMVQALSQLPPPLRDRVFGGPLQAIDEREHLAPVRIALAAVRAMKL